MKVTLCDFLDTCVGTESESLDCVGQEMLNCLINYWVVLLAVARSTNTDHF